MTAPEQAQPDVEARAYAQQVRAALADVPADRLTELLDDLEEHLVEVAAEGGEPLAARLGPPAEYAAELRRAAGLAEPAVSPGSGRDWQAELTAGLDRLRSSPAYGAVRDFLPELRPAWWVLRAWAALVAASAILTGTHSFPVPTFGGSPLVGLLLTGAAVTWSVRRGLRVQRDPGLGHPLVAVLANGALAVLAVVAVFGAGGQAEPAMAWDEPVVPPSELAHEDGAPITNIRPYSATGEPLSGVLLYDQDGRPIDNLSGFTAEGEEVQRVDDVPPSPANAFPRQQRVLVYDRWGNPVWTTPDATPESTPSGTPVDPVVPETPVPDGTVPAPPVEPAP